MRNLIPVTLLLLASCGAHVAEEGREQLVGMKADDLQSCAGIPTRTKRLDPRTELFSYEQKNDNRGGVSMSLPMLGGFTIGGSGSYCTALFRLTDGRVTGVRYTGDNDDTFGREGVCAPIVRGCLRHGREPDAVLPPEPARAPGRDPGSSLRAG
ncbi:hypothetical protein LPC08_11345 [Roseomonas sp. OT10]|uniref:hypothetical protein n=1 Tax=Roseomonas cutis TaxID=2897332 RepID=UPI001E578D48|nr:hypothetical protein [Roseomonas sp. OT10]UFN51149.1 hypothetical protein LPC08_11345 [Roseomonas sp. OT10]